MATANDYIGLLSRFLERRIAPDSFESEFLRMFKADQTQWPEPNYRVLQDLFYAVDSYTPDPALRTNGDVDEKQLRAAAEEAREKLKQLEA